MIRWWSELGWWHGDVGGVTRRPMTKGREDDGEGGGGFGYRWKRRRPQGWCRRGTGLGFSRGKKGDGRKIWHEVTKLDNSTRRETLGGSTRWWWRLTVEYDEGMDSGYTRVGFVQLMNQVNLLEEASWLGSGTTRVGAHAFVR
ncbi:hypothetical protein L1987_59823 [Smallanthus sonchifolius]|uniref:Uncharacterized protein n=1 Tax=Smallanthus sonchifolius TaxID=185202 RepID=A0ACB9D6Y2_9ASTR|nr:hypothetical protein L1987_59823 [Smallanthus sonchifolius]